MVEHSWPSTELSLLTALRDPSDAEMWARFVERYRPPIVDFCQRRMGLQAAAAEDVAQAVLIKLLRAMRGFAYDPQQSFRAWLRTVTRNAVRDHWASEAARPDAATGDSMAARLVMEVAARDNADDLSTLLSVQLAEELLPRAERLVEQRVDERTWRAYQLRRQGSPARDIAEPLEMKVAAVHRAFSRVKRMLREEIATMLRESTDGA